MREIKIGPNCRQIMLMQKAHEFNMDNRHFFRDDVYGIDIEVRLYQFVKECIKEYNNAKPRANH